MKNLKALLKSRGFGAIALIFVLTAFLYIPTPSFLRNTWQEYTGCAAARVISFDTEGVERYFELAVERAFETSDDIGRSDVIVKMDSYVENILEAGDMDDIQEAQRRYFAPCAP